VAGNQHRSRTRLEAEICAEMERQEVPHGHRTLSYRIRMKSGKAAPYRPTIVAHRGPILFLVEPLAAYTPGRGPVERFARFLDQHSPEIVFVAVAPSRIAARLPPESYDELYEEGEVPRFVARIREQDPAGAVRPFTKQR